MAKIFVDYIPDKIIIRELKQYHAYHDAIRNGVPKSERPTLPQSRRSGGTRSLMGAVLYSANSILLRVAQVLKMIRAQERIARNSIRIDEYSSEPMSCGIHKAYTAYGLARLSQNDIVSAIQALSYSAKIHPCLHTTAWGLSKELRNSLLPHEEAEDAIKLFDVIAWEFSGQKLYMP